LCPGVVCVLCAAVVSRCGVCAVYCAERD
jgi:hypothetical protein